MNPLAPLCAFGLLVLLAIIGLLWAASAPRPKPTRKVHHKDWFLPGGAVIPLSEPTWEAELVALGYPQEYVTKEWDTMEL